MLRAKKYAALCIFPVLMSVPIAGLAQKLNATYRAQTVEEVIIDLKKQTNYDFVYQKDVLKEAPRVSGTFENVTITELLDKILMGTGLDYDIVRSTVIIRKLDTATKLSPNRKITGRIVTDNEPLPGVHIRIKGTDVGTVSDIDGQFSIVVNEKESPVLSFSYIGMASREIRISSRTPSYLTINMENSASLDEVVVTGYQTMSRRELASAISTVKAKDVITPNAMSLDQMLQGKIPGMAVMIQSGEPSSVPTIRIRGNSTINGNKAPVWVVDGVIMSDPVPFSASDLNSPDATYLIGNSIGSISPQDIESISVLKDASATAIYGVKAANGVIVITTKKGQVSAPTITYDGTMNVNTQPSYSRFDVMNSQERIQLSKDIYDARLKYPRVPIQESFEGAMQQLLNKQITYNQFEQLVHHYETINTDWFSQLFRNAVTQNHNISLNGGSEKVRYYTSISFNDSPGIAKASESKRFTGLGKISMKINRIFDVDVKLQLGNTNNIGYNESINPYNYAYNTSRAIPLYTTGGERYFYRKSSNASGDPLSFNILEELEQTGKKSRNRNMNFDLTFNAHIIKGLTYSSFLAYNMSNNSLEAWATDHSYSVATLRGYNYGAYEAGEDRYETSVIPFGGTYQEQNISNTSYTWRNTLNYTEVFANKHYVNLFAGTEINSSRYRGSTQLSYGWDPQYGESISPVYTNQYQSRAERGWFSPRLTRKITQIASYIGSASYTFDERYTLNGNIRSDGSNKFGSNPKYRWLPTWSVAGKWQLSNEAFLKNVKFIDFLSLRVSYGVQGNILDEATPNLIVAMGTNNSVSGLRPGTIERLPNPDLRWEKTRSYNIGLDASFFDNRLSFTLDYYRKNTSDLITDMNVSTTTGRAYMSMNSGKAINKGFEGSVSTDLLRNKLFDWNLSFNFSHNTNEIRYAFNANLTGKEKYQNMINGNVATVGQPLGTIYAFEFAGLSAENGYPLFYTNDRRKVYEGDYEVMSLVPMGSIYPDLTGGINTRLTFRKNLSLAIGFTYQVGGVDRLPSIYRDAGSAFDPESNVPTTLAKRWKKPGDEQHTNIPALYDSSIADSFPSSMRGLYENNNAVDVGVQNMYDMSNIRVAKSDFLRLNNITLSYRIPNKWLKAVHTRELTIRATASHLKTWASSAWNGMDPDTASSNMPQMPSYSLGINVIF